jgi:SAM-dependent methyltransferase
MRIECERIDYRRESGFDLTKSLPQQKFQQLLSKEAINGGAILDIGAGPGPNRFLQHAMGDQCVVDGVDIDPRVLANPQLSARWNEPFESAPIGESTYDLAISINVVEHIASPADFFEKVARVLKPNGVFWAYTPHARHPAAVCSRTFEVLGTKDWFVQQSPNVNEYPAYYRLNSRKKVCRAIEPLPFQSAHFYLLPADGWKYYFPKALRWLPEAYERLMRGRSFSVLAYRLKKTGD